jgi:hypothetical protein
VVTADLYLMMKVYLSAVFEVVAVVYVVGEIPHWLLVSCHHFD